MDKRIIDEELQLIPYYPAYDTALAWYQDAALCKQVDNRDEVYDLAMLKRMYVYLDRRGDLFYIQYKGELCGDVCLQADGEVNIVIARPFQNKHIGRRVIRELILLAREKGILQLHAEIYDFNTRSQRMFQSVGFVKTDDKQYTYTISTSY